jgi:3D-(3,5/4)-trihydroxycyclohexane-1,2-dione acylhydrolase (decyclizing)
MNSDLYSTVLAGHKLTVVVCDNGGYAVINRLQVNQGGEPFNNLIADSKVIAPFSVDFAAHAAAMGCRSEKVATIEELEAALARARANDRTTVIVIDVDAYAWTEGGCFWEVGVPEVSVRPSVVAAKAAMEKGKQDQRIGW